MKHDKTLILVACLASLGCQTSRPFASNTKEAAYTEEELAAVERAVDEKTVPVSFTGKLAGLSQRSTRPITAPQYSSRRS